MHINKASEISSNDTRKKTESIHKKPNTVSVSKPGTANTSEQKRQDNSSRNQVYSNYSSVKTNNNVGKAKLGMKKNSMVETSLDN